MCTPQKGATPPCTKKKCRPWQQVGSKSNSTALDWTSCHCSMWCTSHALIGQLYHKPALRIKPSQITKELILETDAYYFLGIAARGLHKDNCTEIFKSRKKIPMFWAYAMPGTHTSTYFWRMLSRISMLECFGIVCILQLRNISYIGGWLLFFPICIDVLCCSML